MKAVEIENISKSYAEVKALSNISFDVARGELFGIIGPDGAGKSTLFDILVTLSYADSGEAWVEGFDVRREERSIRKIIGYMPGRFSLYQDLTVRENIDFFATVFDTTVEDSIDLIHDIWVQIEPFSKRPAGKLSGGMKQKLALCCTLVHRPNVLFLDEPTTGVDPVSRREFWAMLRSLKATGISIVVSTPYMDEAVLCDRVALMQEGRIMKIDTPQSIMDSYDKPLYEIRAHNLHQTVVALRKRDGVHSCYPFGQGAHLTLTNSSSIEQVMSGIEATVKPITASVEDCFMDLMTRG